MAIGSCSCLVSQILALSLLIASHHFPYTLSTRNLEEQQASLKQPIFEHSILDVSASIQKTHNVFFISHIDNSSQLAAISANEQGQTATLALQLYPRLALEDRYQPSKQQQQVEDYRTLTDSRLARDSARVDSLYSKLEIVTQGISLADLKPADETRLEPEALQAPVSSGVSQGSGEYFTRVGVGSPARDFYMIIDTGSDVNWLQCEPCADCYQQTDPIFNPNSSSSYSPLPCAAPQCSRLEISTCGSGSGSGNAAGVCMYQVSYGDGSFTVGDFVTETMSFGSPPKSIGEVAIGCGHDNEGLFIGAAGLLGLGGGPLSLTSQIKARSLSYCLVDRDTARSSTLEFNSNRPGNSVPAPVLKSPKVDTFYYVGLRGISVGGKPLPISPSTFAIDGNGRGGVILDSGTAVTRLTSEAYSALRDAFVQLTGNLTRIFGGFALFDTCYDLSSMTRVRVPTVSFRFGDGGGGGEVSLPAKNYLVPVDSAGTFCFAFAPTTSSLSIIGNIQQQGIRVHFDLANSQVSFAQNSC